MSYEHKQLSKGRWFELSLCEQIANIGSEVERALLWRKKNEEYSKKAVNRALELIDLSLADKKNRKYFKLKEIARLREILVDFFYYENQYSSSEEWLRKYFYAFTYAVRMHK